MEKANIIFSFDSNTITIPCLISDKMKDICIRYSTKIQQNINSLIFLYGGSLLNFELSFKDQATSLDNEINEMKVLVYKNESDEFICPKCGEKIQLNKEKINDIISSNNNIKDTIHGIKLQIDNIVNNSSINSMNIQLKNINIILNTLNDNIQKNIEKLKNLFNDNNTYSNYKIIPTTNNNNIFKNKNVIKGVLDIKLNEIDKNVYLFHTDIYNKIEVYLNNTKINMIKDGKNWKMDYNFKKEGQYFFEMIFIGNIFCLDGFFQQNYNLISLDLSNFNSSNVTNLAGMFHKCSKLKEIKGFNKFITNKVSNMRSMFDQCHELEHLDLSNFNTSNVNNMSLMFRQCFKLKYIKGLNKFNTNKVTDMNAMFQECDELEYLDLSNFDTSNVINLKKLFHGCDKLSIIKGPNKFNTNKVTNMHAMFEGCKSIEYLDLSNFDTSNVTDMAKMFNQCNKLKEIKGINKFITHRVENMRTMFQACYELQYLDLSNFDTSNVKDMSWMFCNCNKLNFLNLLNFTINCETQNMLKFKKNNNTQFITNNKVLRQLYTSS